MPTPLQAMNRLEQAYCENEVLHIKHKGSGYIERPLDTGVWNQCIDCYNKGIK